MRPMMFVGSSSESLDVAYAVQENLDDVAQAIVWTQGIFHLSRSYLESLIDSLDEAEFGVFVFSPEDVTTLRGNDVRTVRDNVIFELGLFIGRLGRERCFLLQPRGVDDFHLPTDLLGITTAQYPPPDRPALLNAALGPACNRIRNAIRAVGPLRKEVQNPGSVDADLLLLLVINEYERVHLKNLAENKTTGYRGQGSLRSELRHLRSLGLIQSLPNRAIGDLATGAKLDLAEYVRLTDLGTRLAARVGR